MPGAFLEARRLQRQVLDVPQLWVENTSGADEAVLAVRAHVVLELRKGLGRWRELDLSQLACRRLDNERHLATHA